MNYKLILLNDGRNILVSDEVLYPKDIQFNINIEQDHILQFTKSEVLSNGKGNWRKVIAGINPLPTLTYSDEVKQKLLEKYNWADEILFANEITQDSEFDKGRWYGRIEGWKEHQSITNKCFSLEQIFKILDLHTDNAPISYLKREIEKSLQQPIQLKVEVEMEYKDGYGNWLNYDKQYWDNHNLKREEHQKDFPKFGIRPKITNNSILITKIL